MTWTDADQADLIRLVVDGVTWTDADQAEVEALTWALVSSAHDHRDRCAACAAERVTRLPCPAVTAAIEALLDWRIGRVLLSRAARERRRELAARLHAVRAELAQLRAAA